ncbi:MAG: hypothetical protein J0M15_02955 [Deltaproteobacteria bacterium]|jgi:hypothetical protein|nr:hypothetical protein [Deltaproteobacteria bacterium]
MLKKASLILFFVTGVAHAGLLFTYHQLTLKNLDQMNALIKNKIKESKSAYSGKLVPLKEALQAIFSRPNTDDMINKVRDPLRNQLDQESSYEIIFEELIQEAIYALKNTKNFKRDVQVTYSIFLENTISEFKPDIKDGNFEMKMLIKISESNIILTKEARKERQLRLMTEGVSPSELAKIILDEHKKNSSQK